MPKKLRLDQLLVGRGFFPSREQARRAILAGYVSVGTRIAAKPSELLGEGTALAVKPTSKVCRPRRAEAGARARTFSH